MKAERPSTSEGLAPERDDLATTFSNLLADIDATVMTKRNAETERKGTLEIHGKNAADIQGAVDDLGKTITIMQASSRPILLQMHSVGNTLKTAVFMANALRLVGAPAQQAVTS